MIRNVQVDFDLFHILSEDGEILFAGNRADSDDMFDAMLTDEERDEIALAHAVEQIVRGEARIY